MYLCAYVTASSETNSNNGSKLQPGGEPIRGEIIIIIIMIIIIIKNHSNGLEWNHGVEWSGVDLWSMYDDGMQCSGVQWNGSMECNAVEWNGMDAFWSFWVLLVILGPNLVAFCQKRKKVNCLTRRRHISAAYLTSLKIYFFLKKITNISKYDFSR